MLVMQSNTTGSQHTKSELSAMPQSCFHWDCSKRSHRLIASRVSPGWIPWGGLGQIGHEINYIVHVHAWNPHCVTHNSHFHFGLLGFQFHVFVGLLGLDFLSFWLLGTGWICEHFCTRRVSLRYRFGTGENVEKKEQFQALHANMNERIVFQNVARYRFW